MDVYATQVDSWYESTDECPYCGAQLKIDYVLDADSVPDKLECPVCGKSAYLEVDWDPIFSLHKQ
jgi:transcription elongation factor Elf1